MCSWQRRWTISTRRVRRCCRARTAPASVAAIDSLCHAYGRHLVIDCGAFSPLLSAWSGARLRHADLQQIQKYTLPQTLASLRGVLLDHLYVADPARTLRGPQPSAPGADSMPPSPLGELRERVAAALAQAGADAEKPAFRHAAAYCGLDGKSVVLHVLHGWGGGAERFVRDLAGADDGRHHLVLNARGNFDRRRYGEVLELHDGTLTQPPLRRLELPDPIASTTFRQPCIQGFSRRCRARVRGGCDHRVVADRPQSRCARAAGLPTTFFIHDFYPLWPLLHGNLDDAQATFDAGQLAADLAGADPGFEFAERDPVYWLELREAFATAALAARANLIAPSRSAMTIFLRLQPRLATLAQSVIAHGLSPWPATTAALPLPAPPARERLRLLVLGRVRRGKAAHLLREAAARAARARRTVPGRRRPRKQRVLRLVATCISC